MPHPARLSPLVGCLLVATTPSLPAADAPPSAPLAPLSGGKGPRFETLAPEATGATFVNPLDLKHPWKYLYASSMATGGVTVHDFDGDGRPDVFFAGGPVPNKLFRQTGPFQFEDVTARAGVDGGDRWAVGAAWADVNGDGRPDLYVCNYLGPNQLFLSNGDGTFAEKAAAAGVALEDASHTPSFCDYDGDGDLDLYVLTNRWYRPEGFPKEQTIEMGPDGQPRVLPKWEKHYDAVRVGDDRVETQVVGRPDKLYRNNGDGTFTDVTVQAGIRHRGHGLSATWFDWTGDDVPDLWVGNDFDDADALYRNNGDGTFTSVLHDAVPYTTWFSMGADFGDVNDDGWPDYFIADMAGTTHYKQKTAMGNMGDKTWFMLNARPAQLMRNCLFLNAHNGRFVEAGYLAGLAESNWTWAVRLADLDLDGRNDVYVQAGMSRNFNEKDDAKALLRDESKTQWDRHEHLPPMKEPSMAFHNAGGLKFTDVSADWGLDHNGMSYGCALADFDRDGAPDFVSVRLEESAAFLRNRTATGHRVAFAFKGLKGNPAGYNVKVSLWTASGRQIRENTPTRGYLGQDEPLVHFGLGAAAVIDRVEVVWRRGQRQVFEKLPADRLYTLTEPEPAGAKPPAKEPAAPLFAATKALASVVHQETPFDDFVREPLLPNKMSHWGPAQAWGDVDGDGDADLYLGQGKNGNRQLFKNEKGVLKAAFDVAFTDVVLEEDMGALFFDADGDGDADLYVVSGSVESDAGSSNYQDRLYLNNGRGAFFIAPAGTLPAETDSGGPVAAADFDRDGDLDLFVGGRCVPGAYPLPGKSRLLRNDGGRFTDATAALAPETADVGMVTGALWTDADGDGWVDLLVSLEWGPLTLFHNEKGRLTPAKATGLEADSGWWNAVAGGDVDGDGDIDYVATNFGLNTKYHASADHPALIYYGVMDESGKPQIVEAEWEGSQLFPVRGRSCSSQAMPFIKRKFGTFRDFALAELPEIYTPEKLQKARKFSVATLSSGFFRNDGKGHFTFDPLPWQAQVSPAFGVVVQDVTGDGRPDIVLGQNFTHAQVETPRLVGGLSLVLAGKGDGTFDPLWPAESGVSLPGDARSVAAVDLDRDGRTELCFAFNAAPATAMAPAPWKETTKPFVVSLKGQKGNPHAVGARVTVSGGSTPAQTAEVAAGTGYLTGNVPELAFVRTAADEIVTVKVRWPDGTSTSAEVKADATPFVTVGRE